MLAIRSLLVAAGLSALSLGTAQAGPLDAATILGGFNAVVLGNFSSTSDVEGAVVIEGNLSGGSATFNAAPRTAPPAGAAAVTVFGSATGGPFNVNNGGSVAVAGSDTARFNLNGGGTLGTSSPYVASDFASVVSLSEQLATLAATGSVNSHDHNNAQLNARPGADGIGVLNVTAAQLASYSGFNVNLNGARTVIINVDAAGSGGRVSLSNHFNNESADRQNVIWNFYNATSLTLGTLWGGAILAPDAAVSNTTAIEGMVLAGSFSGQGELHDYGFAGTLPAVSGQTTGTSGQQGQPVPEPAALALLGSGLVALGMVRRRRRV